MHNFFFFCGQAPIFTSAYIFPQRRQYLPQAFRRRLYGLPLLPDKSGGGAFCPVRRIA